jgi:hypothetical protein
MIEQLAMRFSGNTYDPEQDQSRLAVQLVAVREVMRDGRWRTLETISGLVGAPEASVSARLRDLRKARFGSWTVERRRIVAGAGLHEYRVTAKGATP